MRNLVTVIDAILAVVPYSDGETNHFLRHRLDSIRSSAIVAAPEIQSLFWVKVYNLLASEIPNPKEGWQQTVAAIFRGDPDSACPADTEEAHRG